MNLGFGMYSPVCIIQYGTHNGLKADWLRTSYLWRPCVEMSKLSLVSFVLSSASRLAQLCRFLLCVAKVGCKHVFQTSFVSASARLQASSAQGPHLLRGVGGLCGPWPDCKVHLQSTCCGSLLWAPVPGRDRPARHRESRLAGYLHAATRTAHRYGPAEAWQSDSCLRSTLPEAVLTAKA